MLKLLIHSAVRPGDIPAVHVYLGFLDSTS
jgi:hypothetical protein